MTEPVAAELTELQASQPDYVLEALRLAVQLYASREHDDFTGQAVIHAADEFYDHLTRHRGLTGAVAEEIRTALGTITTKLETIMTQQSDIDAATAALTALTGDVATNVNQLVNVDVPAIQAAIAALPASVDTSALDAAVAAAQGTASSLDTAVSDVTALTTPAASTPPAAPSGTSN
jgi:hypothetical protein